MAPFGQPTHLEALVKQHALECGFDLVRITSAAEFTADRDSALRRIGSGEMDGLPWFTPGRVRRGASPETLLPGARSIICLGVNYYRDDPVDGAAAVRPSGAAVGKVARYARGRDYHRVIKKQMRDYVAGLSQRLECSVDARWYVDDGPMLDRAAARRSGLGWFGKNTNILTPSLGSWLFLGQIITDLELEPDPPLSKSCGSCVRCIDACPTGAITAPYVIDNARCISYLTIENRGSVPVELRPLLGDWVFGCDICQEVCPVNRRAQPVRNQDERGKRLSALDLAELLALTPDQFLERFGGTPIMRAKLAGMKRNACIALGNLCDHSAVPTLARALSEEVPLVRSHAAWALGQIGGAHAANALREAVAAENDFAVLREIEAALEGLGRPSPCAPAPADPGP